VEAQHKLSQMSTLAENVRQRLSEMARRASNFAFQPEFGMVGRVENVGDDVAMVSGLPQAQLNELLLFEQKGDRQPVTGMVLALDPDLIGCAMLGRAEGIVAGGTVHGTGAIANVPVGENLLGRVVNPLGIPLDGGTLPEASGFEPVERPAPGIIERELVSQALETGLLVIDAMLALGRGQRELIIGDRETGKTALAVDTIVNQRNSGVICVYAAVGQKSSSVTQVIEAVRRFGAPERCIFVVAASDDPPGLQWLGPYAACTMAEYFSQRGGDALLVIDDLTSHAVIYRQLSLLLRNPPGREAYPGDIFYIHSRLLERAAKLNHERGGGSLTALPIAATEEGNISAYIPTNLISITDGQIVLEPRLFQEGQKPAVNVGKSVSRVGGKTQPPALRGLAEHLRLEYAQFLELEIFTRFGGMVDERTRRIIEHGRRIRAVLTQPQYSGLSMPHQVALLLALNEGMLDSLPLEKISNFHAALSQALNQQASGLLARIKSTGVLDETARTALRKLLAEFITGIGAAGGAPNTLPSRAA
jgi:F-type H+/Na+-transporting ATPase subunit alpha